VLAVSRVLPLFEIEPAQAAGIRRFSAFSGEDEYLLAPGSRLEVVDVARGGTGLFVVKMREQAGERLVT
jgi:hypothetical protein